MSAPSVVQVGLAKDSFDDNMFAITPSDTVKLRQRTDAIWVGGTGTLVVVNAQGETITFTGAVGWMPIRTWYVKAASTATSLIGVLNRLARQ